MEIGTVVIWLFVLYFILDFGVISSIITTVIIAFVFYGGFQYSGYTSVDAEQESKTTIEQVVPKPDPVALPTAQPEGVTVSLSEFADVSRSYVDISKRNSDTVNIKRTTYKTQACGDSVKCFSDPVMRRHIDKVLYACNTDNLCFVVKE